MGMIGNSLAQGLISGANIQDGTVDVADLKDGSVTSAKLDTNISVDGSLTVDTDTLVVDAANNRVGVGIDVPATALNVKSSSYPYVRVTNDGYTGLDLGQADSSEGGAGLIKLRDSASMKFYTADLERLEIASDGNVNVNKSLQVGNSSITQQYPTSGYIADFQASSGTQTYISIAEPNQTSLGDNGVILGEDQSASYLLQRNNKPLHFGTNNIHNRLSISGAGIVSTDVIQARSHEQLWQFLDLTSLNFNTFYPVTLSGGSAQQIATFELHKYYGNHNPVVNGTTMLGSVSMKMDISAYSWGGIPIYNNVAHLGQVYRSMLGAIGMRGYYFPVLWLRGGYGYHYSCNNPNITPQIATSNSTHYTGGYQYTYGPISETSMVSKSEYLGTTNYTVPQNRSALTHWS